jgi:3,4-dihydroxy 2-butanone 4-phosphate synthase/GTP cyclohydrolase II
VYAVSVDAAGATSGGSLTDRRRTVEALADPTTAAADLRRPGHVFPVIARPGGVLDGGGPAEAALALAQLAGMPAAAVVCEVGSTTDRDTDPDGELAQLARRHRLVLLYLDDVLVHQRLHEDVVRVGAATRLPLPTGPFTAELLVSGVDSVEVLALRLGDLDDAGGPGPLVHVHVECLLGDALGSQRCPCAGRLAAGLAGIAADGSGLLLYLRDGGAAGIVDLLSVYAREDAAPDGGSPGGGHPAPRWDAVADALHVLGVRRVRLAGGDRAALTALGRLGIEVTAAQGPVGVGG